MRKLLIISGSTATGKTSLAINIHAKIPSTLISADSRQVYKEMDIVTGKDHPKNIDIKCIDILYPNEEISLGIWLKHALKHMHNAWKQNKLPIIVGGTGFYIQPFISKIDTISIPPNKRLRQELSKLSTHELQLRLKKLDENKLNSLNNSDINNPYRLIRAIEVATFRNHNPNHESNTLTPPLDTDIKFFITSPPNNYRQHIKNRVVDRINRGAIDETKYLISTYSPKHKSFTALGYRSIIDFINGKINSIEDLIEIWTDQEFAYAKKQELWFKKQTTATVLKPHDMLGVATVVKTIKTWYH